MVRELTNQKGVDRRTVLKGVGVGAVGIGATTGLASAHHPADIGVDNCPGTVTVGEEFTFDVTWEAGHASNASACFRAWISSDGSNWEEVGKTTETGLNTGETRTFTMTGVVDETTEAGTYTLRVNASEAYHRCPNPGECEFPILCDDCQIEVIACVPQSRGSENADPPGHDKDQGDPGGHAHDSDEDREMPGERQGHCKFD